MTLMHQPPTGRSRFLRGTLVLLVLATGCQSSRMAKTKVPGLGWLGSRNATEAAADSMASYPAPSASAIPTTITDSRGGAANAAAVASAPGPVTTPAAPGPALSGSEVAYPETQYGSWPPAPPRSGPIAPTSVTTNAAPAPIPPQVANPYYASIPSGPSQLPGNRPDDVQRGPYPPADNGTANTWGAMAQNTATTSSSSSGGTATWNANGGSTSAPPASYPGSGSVASTSDDDFAPVDTVTTAPVASRTVPASYAAPPVGASPGSGANEFARYEQWDSASSAAVQQALHAEPSAVRNSTGPPPAGEQAAAAVAAPNPAAAVAIPVSPAPPAVGSHYATIAADQVRQGRQGPWRPGSTSRLAAQATAALPTGSVPVSTANSAAGSSGSFSSSRGWD